MKLDNIIDWFRVKNDSEINLLGAETISQMKLMKLLYYVQGVHLAVYGTPAFEESIEAWKYGPVIRYVHDKFKGYRELPLLNESDTDVKLGYAAVQNDEHMRNVVNSVEDAYGDMSAIGLMKQTHKEEPWLNAWNNGNGRNNIISKSSIKKYFKENVVN